MQADLGTWQELESQGLTASEAKVMQEHTQSLDKTTSDLTTLLRDKRAQLAKAEERIEQLEHELAEVGVACLHKPLLAAEGRRPQGYQCCRACSLQGSSSMATSSRGCLAQHPAVV